MKRKLEKILMASAVTSMLFSVAVLSTPYIMDYVEDTYEAIQLQEKQDEAANNFKGFNSQSTESSRKMMETHKDMIVNINSAGASGSGVHLTEHIILTARHVAEGLDTDSLVKTSYGGKIRIEHPVGYLHDENLDISLIILDGMKPAEKRLVDIREGVDDERVFRIGFTGGMNMNSSEGRYEADQLPIEKVNKVGGKIEGLDTFFVAGGPGDSGSAIWSADGKIVGMVNAGPNFSPRMKDKLLESGIRSIDPVKTSIQQDMVRVLIQDNYMLGYSRKLPKAVDNLYNKLQLTGFKKVEPPKPITLADILKKIASKE